MERGRIDNKRRKVGRLPRKRKGALRGSLPLFEISLNLQVNFKDGNKKEKSSKDRKESSHQVQARHGKPVLLSLAAKGTSIPHTLQIAAPSTLSIRH